MAASSKKRLKAQPKNMIFALDIGTRKVIGIVGTVESGKLRVIAMEKEAHTKRSMIDGQIEDIEQVAKVALTVKKRLEAKLQYTLKRVCIAAAGRALKTQRASFEMKFPQPQRLDKEIISRLEAGAICEAEATFTNGLDTNSRRFYLVGHTIVQHYMDSYPVSNLLDHQARLIKADVIATFLPSEVVDSLYSVMHKIHLEVTSLTLEPIAAINAVIPQNLRFLNLALVDIGAGTSDIAVTRDGGVVGYTMATVAGDEITEALMKKYLLDFNTAELIKTQIGSQNTIQVTDILGNEQTVTKDDIMDCVDKSLESLCHEISERIYEINGSSTSAVFLAGGGSKLEGMRASIAKYMNLDVNRVAIAGNNFKTYAFSDSYDLNDPEYATPLGIAVSAGLNLIDESFHVTLNGNEAKLFRNSTITVRDILMMNGYSYHDLLPKAGQKLVVQLNGKQTVYYGTPGEPAVLRVNGQEAKISDLVYMGDNIEFSSAVNGQDAKRCLKDLMTDDPNQTATVNRSIVSPDTPLENGDSIVLKTDPPTPAVDSSNTKPNLETAAELSEGPSPADQGSAPEGQKSAAAVSVDSASSGDRIQFDLNNKTVVLPKKENGVPYYLMDLIERSGIDLEKPTGTFVLRVNGVDSSFLTELKSGDRLEIFYKN